MTKFIVDEMLGNIVRWLRILGFDTLAASDLRQNPSEDIDTKILFLALESKRVLITADLELAKRAKNIGVKVIEISQNKRDTCEILKHILNSLDIIAEARKNKLTRCPVCNGILRVATREEARKYVPPGVFDKTDRFWVCTNCNKFYWVGSHFHNIRKVISCVLRG